MTAVEIVLKARDKLSLSPLQLLLSLALRTMHANADTDSRVDVECGDCLRYLRPVRLLRVSISEGLTQANS